MADLAPLQPVVESMRVSGIDTVAIPQRAPAPELRRAIKRLRRPFVVIADDTVCALGPDQYDRTALDRLISMADGVVIFSAVPPPDAYLAIAVAARAQRNQLIIDTQPEQEIAWTARVRAVCPKMPILLCTATEPRDFEADLAKATGDEGVRDER